MGLDGGEAKSSFFLKRINQVKIRQKRRIRNSSSGDK
jgi:hypothetical protein